MDAPIEWLLAGEPWVEYRTRVDLLHQAENEPEVVSSREAMLASPLVTNLLRELEEWPGPPVNSHKSAGVLFHKLAFLADLGLKSDDQGMPVIIERILEHHDTAGPFQVVGNIPVHFGGTGKEQWAWALCDTPLILYALIRMGMEHEPIVQAALEYLTNLVRDNGWPCAVSKELGKFRGPGRKDDPCPFANMIMLKALAHSASSKDSRASRIGVETALSLWSNSQNSHPYMFFMGNDFRKLKAPLIWYDIINVLDTLSQYPWVRRDSRLNEMEDMVMGKADDQGRFTPESIWTAWKDWEFGQKKVPSRLLTLLAWRIYDRING